ncbi:microsomal glutathione S-transferase 1 isoform X1 [Rhagoletis pomonella]|uniref:microsomal glutathione S-transferase 1 isoform X1 n=1 Tax=Rhagoletis pomonella TaxID=28610 RepID=UPI001783167A|nr:microsomal glutathione S-transferase 1 isoform X1 [Rhagoletis pomonella]
MAKIAFELLTLENEVLRAYLFWSAILVLKMLFMSLLTGLMRFRTQTFANPEDLLDKRLKVKFDNSDVERVRRAHRNDLENILPFFAIGFLYVLIDPAPGLAINLFRAVGIARIIHTIVYAVVVMPQPSRALAFFVALGATVYMAVQVLLAAL